MTLDTFKKHVAKNFADAQVKKVGDIALVTINLADDNHIYGWLPVASIVGVDGIKAQAADAEGKSHVVYIADGTETIGTWDLRLTCETCEEVVFPASVKKLGDYAFQGYEALKSVVIPDGVTEIGYSAFDGCTSLQSVSIPDSVTKIGGRVFKGCTALQSVSIPAGVTKIDDSAFSGCTALHDLVLPQGLTVISGSAFENCDLGGFAYENDQYLFRDGLLIQKENMELMTVVGKNIREAESYTIPADIKVIGERAFFEFKALKSITIPEGVTTIGMHAFAGSALESVVIPSTGAGVTKIDFETFSECTALQSVTLPDGITEIAQGAFGGCTALQSINLPDSITKIGQAAFCGCRALQSINLPDSITSIGKSAFSRCTALQSINLPDSITEIGKFAFIECEVLANVTIPAGMTSISEECFRRCRALQSIVIPSHVTKVCENAFSDCSALKSITLCEGVQELDNCAFADTAVEEIVLPESMRCVNGSFYNCQLLRTLTWTSKNTSIIGEAFNECTALEQVSLPQGMTWSKVKDKFQGTPWGENGSKVVSARKAKEAEAKAKEEKMAGLRQASLEAMMKDAIGGSDAEANTENDTVCVCGTTATGGYAVVQLATATDPLTYDWAALKAQTAALQPGEIVMVGVQPKDMDGYVKKYKATSVRIAEGTTELKDSNWNADGVFEDCTTLQQVVLPEGLTLIGSTTFRDCTALRSINFPSTLTKIGFKAFSGCTALEGAIVLPASLEELGSDVFEGCTKITSITLQSSAAAFSTNIFDTCTSLREVSSPTWTLTRKG